MLTYTQKRKSVGDGADHPSKKPKTQMKAVIRTKPDAKAKTAKSKKTAKAKAKASKRASASSPELSLAERRRSGRAQKVNDYAETADKEADAEMLDGVAEWKYGDDDSDEASGDAEDSAEEESEEEED